MPDRPAVAEPEQPVTLEADRIETRVIQSWTELVDTLYENAWDPAIERFRSPFVFRGQCDCRSNLSTSLMRLGRGHDNLARLEGHLLRNFRKYAHMDATVGPSIWNWLALAQHHGLHTR